MVNARYIAYVLRTLNRIGMIPAHEDARAALQYARDNGLVADANGNAVVTRKGLDFIQDFIDEDRD